MKLKVFEAFAGYGSQAMALNRLRENYPQFDYEVVGISEIDKYALYQIMHNRIEELINEHQLMTTI